MMGVAGFESLYTSASEEEGESLYWGPSTVDTYLQGQGQVSMLQGMSRCVCVCLHSSSQDGGGGL